MFGFSPAEPWQELVAVVWLNMVGQPWAHLGAAIKREKRRAAGKARSVRPVKGQTLRELAYLELRYALLTGHFAPGQAITIKDVARQMALGIMPVREAVQQLAFQGALELLPNRSVRVPVHSAEELERIFEARTVVECYAASRAAASISSKELEQASDLLKSMFSVRRSVPLTTVLQANYDFHFLIYGAARSNYLTEMIERLWLRIGPLHATVFQATAREREDYFSVLPLHQALVSAFGRRDGQGAGMKVHELLNRSLAWYQRHAVG